MNWCQTERMNLKYVEINWNVIFQKSFSSWFEKAKDENDFWKNYISVYFNIFQVHSFSLTSIH